MLCQVGYYYKYQSNIKVKSTAVLLTESVCTINKVQCYKSTAVLSQLSNLRV